MGVRAGQCGCGRVCEGEEEAPISTRNKEQQKNHYRQANTRIRHTSYHHIPTIHSFFSSFTELPCTVRITLFTLSIIHFIHSLIHYLLHSSCHIEGGPILSFKEGSVMINCTLIILIIIIIIDPLCKSMGDWF